MKCFMTGKPCDFQMEKPETTAPGKKGVFIASPFGFPFDSIYGSSDSVIKSESSGGEPNNVQEALREGKLALEPKRADQAVRLGSIMCQGICKEILQRDYLLADLTKPNPNVYYELGLAYALGKHVICCVNEEMGNRHLDMFQSARRRSGIHSNQEADGRGIQAGIAYVPYRTRDDLTRGIQNLEKNLVPRLEVAEKHPCFGERNIVIIENGESEISGMYADMVREVLSEGDETFKFDEELLNSLNDRDRGLFKREDWKGVRTASSRIGWDVKTIRITKKSLLGDVVNQLLKSRICIVDTSAYEKENTDQSNPYMFFCLGLTHGLEKDVIPITNTLHSNPTPFDVTGLWHVYYSRLHELRTGLLRILPRICVDYHREIEEHPYRRIWDCFLRDERRLAIFYCGRAIDRPNDPNKFRTIIDSWDSQAVSEASYYLAQKYPTTLIRPEPPKTKERGEPSKGVLGNIGEELSKPNSNYLVVGSPDVSDYAEVLLSKIFRVIPYRTRRGLGKENKGFIFYKKELKRVQSAFYTASGANKRDSVEFPGGHHEINERKTYGVLVIARNPFNNRKRVMVLSGYTGLATCGLMQLLIDTEINKDVKNLENKYCLKDEINSYFDPGNEDPFMALVEFRFEDARSGEKASRSNVGAERDARRLTEVRVIQAMHLKVEKAVPKRVPSGLKARMPRSKPAGRRPRRAARIGK